MNQTTRFRLACALAAAAGFLSLSQEILWVKVVANAFRNSPMAFGTVLGCFLTGIALGALLAPRVQARLRVGELQFVAGGVAAASVLFWLSPPVLARLLPVSETLGIVALHVAAGMSAALMGGVLPLLARFGVPDDAHVGANVALVYLSNVLGATLGPLFTGFVLLDVEAMERAIFAIAVAGILAGELLWWFGGERRGGRRRLQVVGGAASVAALMALSHGRVYDGLLERLHFKDGRAESRYRFVAQGRSGVVGVSQSGALYGEGLYDGGYNVDPAANTNLITRAYLLPILHPSPRRVIEIGLGSGSWTHVMASHPDVESLAVLEINPRYEAALRRHREVADVLDDPRVSVHYDDGRRWLRRTGERYDAVVINGTWHWRAHATHLLSAEFLREIKARLAPGGIVYFNTTQSDDAAYTAAGVFEHVVRYMNFVAASDRPIEMDAARRRARLLMFPGHDGKPLFADSANVAARETLVALPLEDVGAELRAAPNLWYVTENNMATEFKTNWSGRWWRELPARAFVPERGWLSVLFP